MSRRRRNGIIAVCVLAAIILVRLDQSTVRNKGQSEPKSDEQVKAGDLEKYHEKTFLVTNVVDGDTIDIDAPDGKFGHTRIRLWGVDTPETKKPGAEVMYFGPEATEVTTKLALGKQVRLYLDSKSTRGKYGRLLAYVQLPDGEFLNEVLLAEGFAYADLRFRHNFYYKYQQLETIARSQKKGLWEKVTREQLPQWLQRKRSKK